MALPDKWWRDAEQLRAQVEQYGSLRKAAAAHGVDDSNLSKWWRRHHLPELRERHPAITPFRVEETRWGEGRPRLVKPSTKDATELVVFTSDWHAPYVDWGVFTAMLEVLNDLQPHRIILNGDLSDFFQISRFNVSRSREDSLQEDIDERNHLVSLVRNAAPDARIDETDGNHDSRVRSWIAQNAKPLSSLRALHPDELFRRGEYDVHWHPGCGFLLRPDFLVKHGTKVSALPNGTARAEALANLCSGISGHVHRAEQWRHVGVRHIEWTVSGCCCRLEPDYIVGQPNWTQGIAIGEFSTRTDAFHVSQLPYVDGFLRHGTRSYGKGVTVAA